jgi:Insertion element 4 transposase N-terminal
VLSYLPAAVDASWTAESPDAGTPAGTIVVRAADLQLRGGGTVTAGDAAPSAGELAVFCRPVVTAPAVIGRDGSVRADGWLPDFVRLGVLERHLGDGVIEEMVAAALEQGRLRKPQRRRIMSYPLVIRLLLAMTLTPDASYREALARLAGLLADVPFALAWHVPTEKVVTHWRKPVPASLIEALFWRAAGPLIGDDEPSAVLLAGRMVCAADGMLVNAADTPANRKAFGCAGTTAQEGAGSAPFPQVRIVALTARAGRAMLGAICGRALAGEQTLLARLVRRRPGLFAGRVICFDRNFPGYDLITAILQAGGHVVARVKAGISLPMTEDGGWLPDGSRLTWLNAPSGKKGDRLPVRAAEHNAVLPRGGEEVSGDLHPDHHPPRSPGRARRRGPGGVPDQVERVRDHVRRGQSHHRRRREPHVRAGAALRLPAPGHSGSLGLADHHPAGPCQRRRRPAPTRRAGPRPAPEGQRPGHRGRGILHRRPPSRDPVHDIIPGHRVIVAGRARRRSRRRRPRRTAHPERPRPGTPLPARPESPPEIPAHRRDQADRYRETPGHRVRGQWRVAAARQQDPSGRRNRPARRGRGPWNRAPPPPRHAGKNHARTSPPPPQNRLKDSHRTQGP